MGFYGSTLLTPLRADQRGTFATTADADRIAEQYILAVIQTRQGERVMLPDFGLPDYVFAVAGPALAAVLAFQIEEQVGFYVPGVEIVEVRTGGMSGGAFFENAGSDDHHVAVKITWRRTGAREPRSLVYPFWRLINGEG